MLLLMGSYEQKGDFVLKERQETSQSGSKTGSGKKRWAEEKKWGEGPTDYAEKDDK